MGEPFHGHFAQGHEHEVLFYESHPESSYQNIPSRERPPLAMTMKVQDNLKENVTRVPSPEFNLFHMASPDLERLIVGQSTATTATRETTTINSSDLNVLNLVSPDFDKIFSNIQGGTEESALRESGVRDSRGVDFHGQGNSVEEQHEIYTKTFVDALQKIHEQQVSEREHASSKADRTGLNNGRDTRDVSNEESSRLTLEHHPEFYKLHAHAKLSENVRDHMESHVREFQNRELGIDPSTFSLPPIDLQVQEIVKRERKKQKNRVAASKCRKKKLEREAQLEVSVQQLRERNIELNAVANALRNQVTDLKQRVMEHIACGCHVTSLTVAY